MTLFRNILVVLAVLAVIGIGLLVYVEAVGVDQLKDANDSHLVVKGSGPIKPNGVSYYIAKNLQDDVVSTYNTTPPFKYHVLGSTCVVNGRQAVCLLRTKTINIVSNVTISADGKTYISITKE